MGHRFVRGWLSRLEFHRLTVNQARALAQCQDARLLRELVVEEVESESPVGTQEQYISSYYEPGPDVPGNVGSYDAPGLHALCRCPHLASVRLFQLGETVVQPGGKEEEYYNCHTSGELAYHLVKQMPNLEELYLLAHRVDAEQDLPPADAKPSDLPTLPQQQLPARQASREQVAYEPDNAPLPPARTGIRRRGAGAYIRLPISGDLPLAAPDEPDPPPTAADRLRRRGGERVVESGILKRLKVLDLQGGCITDEGARLLAGRPRSEAPGIPQPEPNALTKTRRADDPGDSGEGGSLRSAWPNTGRRRGRHARVPVRGRHRVTPCTSPGTS